METFITKLDSRIREVQAELVELQTAKRVYNSLTANHAQAATQNADVKQSTVQLQPGNINVVLKAA